MPRSTSRPLDPLAPEEHVALESGPAAPRGMRAAVACLALLFFTVPLALGAVGVSGGRLVGERAAPRPSLAEGWDAFGTATRYLAVHLPGRLRAVEANNWITRELLGSTPVYGTTVTDRTLPSGSVAPAPASDAERTGGAQPGHAPFVRGLHGWSFLQGELDLNCRQPVAVGVALQRWRALVEAIRASGRRVVLLIVPEKSTIYPELLGARAPNGQCALSNKARMWARIEALRQPDILDMRRHLLTLKRTSEQQLYLTVNSHWNDFGGVELAKLALAHVGGRARIRSQDLVRGTARYPSDLSRFSGEDTYATTPTLRVDRRGQGIAITSSMELRGGGMASVSRVRGTDPPVIPGATLFMHDSFGDSPLPMLEPYAARLVGSNWQTTTPDDLVRLVKDSDTVILEAVERTFLGLPSKLALADKRAALTPETLAHLRRALRAQ
jgi:hypothetical protein